LDAQSSASESEVEEVPAGGGEVFRDLLKQWDDERARLWDRNEDLETHLKRSQQKSEMNFKALEAMTARAETLQVKRKKLLFESVFYRQSYECQHAQTIFQYWRAETLHRHRARLQKTCDGFEEVRRKEKQDAMLSTMRQVFEQMMSATVTQCFTSWKQYIADCRTGHKNNEISMMSGAMEEHLENFQRKQERLQKKHEARVEELRKEMGDLQHMLDQANADGQRALMEVQQYHTKLVEQEMASAKQVADLQGRLSKAEDGWDTSQRRCARSKARTTCAVYKWRKYETLVLECYIFATWRQMVVGRPPSQEAEHGFLLPPVVTPAAKGSLPYTVIRDPLMLQQAQQWLQQAPGTLGLGIVYLGPTEGRKVKSSKKQRDVKQFQVSPWPEARALQPPDPYGKFSHWGGKVHAMGLGPHQPLPAMQRSASSGGLPSRDKMAF